MKLFDRLFGKPPALPSAKEFDKLAPPSEDPTPTHREYPVISLVSEDNRWAYRLETRGVDGSVTTKIVYGGDPVSYDDTEDDGEPETLFQIASRRSGKAELMLTAADHHRDPSKWTTHELTRLPLHERLWLGLERLQAGPSPEKEVAARRGHGRYDFEVDDEGLVLDRGIVRRILEEQVEAMALRIRDDITYGGGRHVHSGHVIREGIDPHDYDWDDEPLPTKTDRLTALKGSAACGISATEANDFLRSLPPPEVV